jgi:hypothetical protein
LNLYLKRLFVTRLRKILFAILVIIVALSTIVYAYFVSVSSPETVGSSVSITSPPLQLSLSLDKMNYQTSDNMTVGFSLRNISNRTVAVTKGSYSSVGLGHYDPVFNLTTTTEGVSTAYSDELDNRFHFGFTLFDSNETIDQEPILVYDEVYDIHLEPGGTLNQTFKLSLQSLGELATPGTQVPQKGTFQILASLPNFWINGITAPTVTLETPSIAFTIR